MKRLITILAFCLFTMPCAAWGATYYVKDDATGSANGLSDANAWTIAQLQAATLTAGDDVYFKCGATWTSSTTVLTIDWAGASTANTSIIGAYYMDPAETVGVNGDGKPILYSTATTGYQPISITDQPYIELTNLDIRGGRRAIFLSNADYITIHGCVIGKASTGWGIQSTYSANSTIYDNTFDPEVLTHGQHTYGENPTNALYDGIATYGSNHKIYRNTFADWGHSAVNISSGDYVEVYSNYFSFTNIAYGRAFAFEAPSGSADVATYDKFYNNYILDQKTRSQLGSASYCEVYNNIWDTTVTEALNPDNNEEALVLGPYGGSSPSVTYCKIVNNVIYATSDDGIELSNWGGDVTNNEISNNIILNGGTDGTGFYGIKVLKYADKGTIGNNTFRNNKVYYSGRTNTIYYKGTAMSVATFNTSDADSDSISGNIATDANFTDAASGDFTIVSGDEIDGGVDVSALSSGSANGLADSASWPPSGDMPTISRLDNDGYDIGAYEFQSEIPPDGSGTINATQDNIDDDGEVITPTNSWSTDAGSNDRIAFGDNNTTDYHSHFRFVLDVAQGSTITAAYITFRCLVGKSAGLNVNIYAEDADDATTIASYAAYDGLSLTDAVNWQPGAVLAGSDYDTPSLVDIVQTVVDRASWASGNQINFIIKDNGSSTYEIFNTPEATVSGQPVLHVEYGAVPDATAPTVEEIGVWDGDSCEQNVSDNWGQETVTVCMELSEDVIVTDSSVNWTMTVGPTTETLAGTYLRKTTDGATTVLLMDFTFTEGMRKDNPQMGTASGGTIQDGSDNAIDFSNSDGDLDGTGTITIAVARSADNPWMISATGEYATVTALKAATSIEDGDNFTLGTITEPGALDLSGDDCTEADPCVITLSGTWTHVGAGLTMGDWWTIVGAGNQISGAFTGGANNVIQRVEFK